ncbi:MAG TPA: hypothetical protein VMR50_12540 [Myxococcota bacterium]|nr:hypothetical protein [Myxococcota bacterium]
MPRSITRLASLSLVPLAALALAGSAVAKTKTPKDPKQMCQKHVMEKIKAKHAGAHDIQLTQTREFQPTTTQNGVGGTGTLKASNNSAREFEWSCTYDTKTGKIVNVDVDKPMRDKK